MAEPFLSEIRIMTFPFPPKGWAQCDGQKMPINQNQAMFSLLGTTYGGDGRTTFGLPDLRGRTPIREGNGHPIGQVGGEQAHTVTLPEMPLHTHQANATSVVATTGTGSTSLMLAQSTPQNLYASATNLVAMNAAAVTTVGGGQGHQNMQPFLALNFCIALQGIFPSPN